MEKPKQQTQLKQIPVSNKKYHITTQKRSIEEYVKAGDIN